jgi:putative transposase
MMFDADCHSVMAAWNQKRRDPGMLEERRKKAVRMIVVDGASKGEVAKVVGVSLTAVKNWCRAYAKGEEGFDALNSGKHTGRPSRMDGRQLDRLGNMLLKGAEHYGYDVDLWTTKRVASLIEEKFGVRYHPDHVRKILHGMDFSSQKTEGRAREYDEKKVRDWARNVLPDIKKPD